MRLLGVDARELDRPEMRPLIAGHLLVIPLALLVGYWIGNNSWRMLTLLVALPVFCFAVIWMQNRAWVLIIFGWLFTGQMLLLPLPFAVRDLSIMLAFCAYVGYRVVSHRSVRAGWSMIDILLAVHLGYVAFDYVLHPVGFFALGAETIGARPYLNIMLAVIGYWLLVHLPDSVKTVARIPYFFLAAASVLSGLGLLLYIFPSLMPYVYGWYSELDLTAYYKSLSGTDDPESTRLKQLGLYGYYQVLLLCSYYPPATLFNPRRGRFYAMMAGMACVLLTGFRSILLWSMAAVGVGGWLYRRRRELAVGAVAGALLLGVLAAGQGRLYDLPFSMQRTLSFLPGRWDAQVVKDAQGSSEWRFQLWKDVIEWHYIKDWWFGDGFGAKTADLAALSSTRRSASEDRDFVLATGGYHNGPLSTIRYVGIIGLIQLYLLAITAAIYSYKVVQRCRGTPLFGVAVFMAIQLIWGPVHFTFVFGGYNSYLPDLMIELGILRLLMRLCDEGLPVAATAPTARATVPAKVSALA